jgi:hypothetical protein
MQPHDDHETNLLKLLNRWSAPLAALVIIMGGAVWLTTLHFISSDNKEKIQSLRLDHSNADTRLLDIADRLARIETKLDLLLNQLGQKK